MSDETVLVPITFWNKVQTYTYAVIFSLWICVKSLVRWIWNYNTSTLPKVRDSPPSILVDTAVGRHSYVKVQGVKLHYVECGESGPPVLLLHGFPDCWVGWRAQMEELRNKARPRALDLMGCGDSDKPQWRGAYAPEYILAQLKAQLRQLRVKGPTTLVAHDLGGLLAWYLAHDCPELIERLVIVSCPHPNVFWDTLPPASPFNLRWMQTAQVPYLAEFEALRGDLALLEKCHARPAPLLEAYKYVFSRRQDWTGPINYFRNFMFWRVSEERGKIKVPVLLVTGNRDTQVTLESMVRSAEYCAHATLKVLDGAGHAPHQDVPHRFNRLLCDFLLAEDKIVPVPKSSLAHMSVDAARGLVGRVLGAVHLFS